MNNFLDLKRPSIAIAFLLYIVASWTKISVSFFFSFATLAGVFFILTSVDLLLANLWARASTRYRYIFLTSFLFFIFTLFGLDVLYGLHEVRRIVGFENFIRDRTLLKVFLLIVIPVWLAVFRNPYSFKVLNVFMIILSLVIVVSYQGNDLLVERISQPLLPDKISEAQDIKPIILLVSDEYSSPDDLYELVGDSSIYALSNDLPANGWIVNNNLFSSQASSIHSIASLFNYNLDYPKFSGEPVQFVSNFLFKSSLYDDLNKSGVTINNFGIFDFGEFKPLTRAYFYPSNFLELILSNTILPLIFINTQELNLSGFKNSFNHYDKHNQFILNDLEDSIKQIDSKKVFIYAHLLMPHFPYSFGDEFQFKEYGLGGYLEYYKFTNKKLAILLDGLVKQKKYRIILTGDHGYRGDNRIDRFSTFAAFYGFNKKDLEQVTAVQDLGLLVSMYLHVMPD